MSSPIASEKKGVVQKQLIEIHQKYSHNHRISILAKELKDLIQSQIAAGDTQRPLQALDIGCGDMQISESISELLPQIQWKCLDLYDLPENLASDPRWKKYLKFDGRKLPFADQTFDFVMFCDVLHHCIETQAELLREAARVSKYVVIKDHFEYSIVSRSILQLMDIVGNWGYGVSIPREYWKKEQFTQLVQQNGLQISTLKVGIPLYDHLPIARQLLSPNWQFIAVLKSQS